MMGRLFARLLRRLGRIEPAVPSRKTFCDPTLARVRFHLFDRA